MKVFILFLTFCTCIFPKYKLAIAMQFKNDAPYLLEWIQYHTLVGVDHFYLYDDASTDNSREILQPYINSGLVELYDSPKVSPMELSWEPRQLASYYDAVTRARNNADWIALIDSDEILVPTKGMDIPKILNNYFSHADGIYVNWRNFGTSNKTIEKGKPIFTELLMSTKRKHFRNWIGKSIIRPEAADMDIMFDYVHFFQFLPGKLFVNGNRKKATIVNCCYNSNRKNNDQFIRINHYALRDEKYFWEVRMKRDNYGYGDNDGSGKLFMEHYEQFNTTVDRRVHDIIKKKMNQLDSSVWK